MGGRDGCSGICGMTNYQSKVTFLTGKSNSFSPTFQGFIRVFFDPCFFFRKIFDPCCFCISDGEEVGAAQILRGEGYNTRRTK